MNSMRLARRIGAAPFVVLLAAAACLTACSSSGSSATTTAAPQSDVPATSSSPEATPVQKVDVGTTVTLPTDTITVSAVLDRAAPKATPPETPSTHWASATVKQCATGPSRQGEWELALADGTSAPEASSWIEGELPRQLQPSEEALAAGDCVSGDVYFVVPDGARTTGVVLESRTSSPARAQVTWSVA